MEKLIDLSIYVPDVILYLGGFILSSYIFPDIIETILNRFPKIMEADQEPIEIAPAPPNYKSRLLDINSYYYVKTNDPNYLEKRNYVPANTVRLNKEYEIQADHFKTELTMSDYLRGKRMLLRYHNGSLIRALLSSPKQSSLSNYLDYFKP